MARIRTIKPMFFQDETLCALDVETHILAAGLLCYADDEGYFNANPKLVQAAIFPLRDLSQPIHCMLSELARTDYIRIGKGPDGKEYGHIVNFNKHQRINRKTPSVISKLDISWMTHTQLSESSSQIPSGIRNKEILQLLPKQQLEESPIKAKPKRRTATDLEYNPEVKVIVNDVTPVWPDKRPADNSAIRIDMALLAARIDKLLKSGVSAELLKKSADLYLSTNKGYWTAPQYFFGDGKQGTANWKDYAKMVKYEEEQAAKQVTQ